MPPQNKSIRDFFKPVQKDREDAQSSAPKHAEPRHFANPRDRPSDSTGTFEHSSRSFQPASPRSNQPCNASRSTTSENLSFTTSQSSLPSSIASKRVVSNGEQVVLNSDSESDSLPDLEWSLLAKPINVPRIKPIFHENDLRKPPEKKKDEKAFMRLLQSAQRNAQSEREIAEVKADLDKPVIEESTSTRFDINEETLQTVVHGGEDPNKARKLFLAMQRTNALHTDCVFHFWRKDRVDHAFTDSPFPIDCLPNHQWASVFEEAPARNQAFLSGFALQVFRVQQLPQELASWLIDQICRGRNDVLSDRYLELLEKHQSHFQVLIDKTRVSSMFYDIGADPTRLDPQRQVDPSLDFANDDRIPLPSTISQVCRLLQTAARYLTRDVISHALYIMLHLCMDIDVVSDASTLTFVRQTIETIVCNISDNKDLAFILNDTVPLLLARIKHPILQRQLIESLPARSPLTAYLQRHLALSFLLQPTAIEVPLHDAKIAVFISEYLQKSPHFHIHRKTDYTHLAARLEMLDIAIGPGLLNVPYQPLLSLPPSPVEEATVLPPRLTGDEKAFNEQVDALAHHVEVVSSSIVESGGIVDLSRLQAKDCSERIYHRLQNAVRIGGKKKFNVFGSNDMEFDTTVWKGFAKMASKRKASEQLKTDE